MLKLSVLFVLLSGTAFAQKDWVLHDQHEGISIYTRTFPDSKFKAIRVKCRVNTTLSRLVAVILDVNTARQWVYGTKSAVLLRQVSPSELFYYSVIELPWPVNNRDFIAHLTVSQDPQTSVVTIDGPTLPTYMPPKQGIVRVPTGEGHWVLTPLGGGVVAIDYILRTDPGGNLPAWLVNLFVTKGPLQTFAALQKQLRDSKVRADFIKEPVSKADTF
ncbi:START domain-containing protein [Dinghuibacter silviterrae]|uniref:START domain-containing protein n=1 Tax=Dinghuibacter silviterrae TaxID=1539049 RepID=A0A4R8DVT3_9BACT|nr:START domain-containing protein [Dinghuibacter silviterrae]TDX01527.1 START domain-containing protein [Dinghuibacter silviterrae]